jgi:hypothetical protein
MTDEQTEINKFLHTVVAGKCWHEVHPRSAELGLRYGKCLNCGDSVNTLWCDEEYTPDYCSESSPRSLLSELERKAIEEKGGIAYSDELINLLHDQVSENDPDDYLYGLILTAPAAVRARAIAKMYGKG